MLCEAERHRAQCVNGAQKQACADKKNKRECELRNDKRFASAILAGRCGAAHATQIALHIAAHGTQRGKDAYNNRGEKRERNHCSNYAAIQMNSVGQRQLAMDLPPKQLDRCLSQEQSKDSADAAQQQAFDDGLLQQAQAAGAQRSAHCLLAAARDGARQHEAGDVEAGQQPDAKDHRIEQQERLANMLVQRLLITGDSHACGQATVWHFLGNHGLGAAQVIGQLRLRDAIG